MLRIEANLPYECGFEYRQGGTMKLLSGTKGEKAAPIRKPPQDFSVQAARWCKQTEHRIRARYFRFRGEKVDTKFVLRYNIVKYLQ